MSKPTTAIHEQLLSEEQIHRLNQAIMQKRAKLNEVQEQMMSLKASINVHEVLLPKKEELDKEAQELQSLKNKFDKAKENHEWAVKHLSEGSTLRKQYETAYHAADPAYHGFKMYYTKFMQDVDHRKSSLRSDGLRLSMLKIQEMDLSFELNRLLRLKEQNEIKLAEIKRKQQEAIQKEREKEREIALEKQRSIEEAKAKIEEVKVKAEFEARQKAEAEAKLREAAQIKAKKEASDQALIEIPAFESELTAWSKEAEENRVKGKNLHQELTKLLEDVQLMKWLETLSCTDHLFTTAKEAFKNDIKERTRMLKVSATALLPLFEKIKREAEEFITRIKQYSNVIPKENVEIHTKLNERLLIMPLRQSTHMTVYLQEISELLKQLPPPPTDYAYLFLYVSDYDSSLDREKQRKLAEEERKRHEAHLQRIETERRKYQEHCQKVAAELKRKQEEEERHRAILHQRELQRQREASASALERAQEEERQQQARRVRAQAAVPLAR